MTTVLLDNVRKMMMLWKLITMGFLGVISWAVLNILHGVDNASNPEVVVQPIIHDNHHVLLFDGECNLCNKFVDMVIYFDKKKKLTFHPLQGETGRSCMTTLGKNTEDLTTMIYIRKMDEDAFHPKHEVYTKSDAVLKIAEDLEFHPSLIAVISACFPMKMRNYLYDWVVANRYDWFGKREECRCSM